MPKLLTKNYILALLVLVAVTGFVVFFDVPGSAARSRQTSALAFGGASNSSSFSNSAAPRTIQSDGEIQVVLTTYQGGRVFSQVIGHAINVNATANAAPNDPVPNAPPAAGEIVFSQIYSRGGIPGSTFQNNYLEFFNKSNNTVDFGGCQIYIATDTGVFDRSISFVSSRGIFIPPHRYLLIKFGPDSTNGAPLPNPDLTAIFHIDPPPGVPPIPDLNLSPSGKVFLTVPGTSLLGTTCPLPNSQILDFVGYGATANCFEGSGPTETTSNTTAVLRKNGGFIDTDNNANDFALRPPSPRNSSNRPIDDAEFFVRQHYGDFLNREPDAAGLAFWVNDIISCGADPQCIEVKRINVSAAFFLSIEFEHTGYLVERLYKASYGDATGTSTVGGSHQLPVPIIRMSEFLADTQQIRQGLIVGQPGWELVLENNKRAFIDQFVQRTRFTTDYPVSMTAAEFVDTLNTRAGGVLSPDERNQLVADLSSSAKTRAEVLRAVAEDVDLFNGERNRAFVLMQYLGYLRRNPNDPPDSDYSGYDFWLTKLNQFNGNFISAEMVKAFISSIEYRQRF